MVRTQKSWGGKWTEEKLDTFEKYVKAYLAIMNKNRDPYGWKLLYFDGFAGSGTRLVNDNVITPEAALDLFGQNVPENDFNVYRGAAERVVKLESEGIRGFDYYYFIEKDEESCNSLQEKLSGYKTVGNKCYRNWDANEGVQKLATTLNNDRRFKAFAFLDPFGMQIDWTSIQRLKGLSVDLWILVPTGVIVNRLLERKVISSKGLEHAEKLESFFGLSQEEIRSFFYRETELPSLFGDTEIVITKAENSIRKIAELYIERLKGVFPFVTEEPLVLYNTQNVPIYHLVFAAKNGTAMKIAQEIINNR